MIRNKVLSWLGLVLASSGTACSSTPLSLGSGTDEVVSTTDGNDDEDDEDQNGNDSMPSNPDDSDDDGTGEDDGTGHDDSDDEGNGDGDDMTPPQMGGCDLGGVHYEEGEEIPSSDCNSMWCQDGQIATTLVYCPPTLEECESTLAACRMAGTSMTCAQDYNLCIGQVEPVDMCQSAVEMCIASGEDVMICATRYNCDGVPTSPDECETLQSECFMNNGMMCDELYNECLANMNPPPAEDMCQASIEMCIAAGESEAACRMQYAGCGGLPPTARECQDALENCQTGSMPVACEETYEACMAAVRPRTVADCEAQLETCRANGMSMNCAQDYNTCVATAEE